MLKSIQQRDLQKNRWIKISMTVLLLIICGSMLLYLIPGLNNGMASTTSADAVANVGGQDITLTEVQQQISRMNQNGAIPDMLKGLYARQILDQLIFQHALDLEAERLGITVTDDEETQRIKQILPDAWSSGVWQRTATPRKSRRARACPWLNSKKFFAMACLRIRFANLSPTESPSAPPKSNRNSAAKMKKSQSNTR